MLTSKQIFFGGNAKVGAGLFAGEIELNTCCVAMVKLLGESCRVIDGSGDLDWPKIYTCHPGPFPPRVDRVPCGCPSHRCKAKLKYSSSEARTDYVDYNNCSCKCPFVYHWDYNDCTCKTQRPLTSIRWIIDIQRTGLATRSESCRSFERITCVFGNKMASVSN